MAYRRANLIEILNEMNRITIYSYFFTDFLARTVTGRRFGLAVLFPGEGCKRRVE